MERLESLIPGPVPVPADRPAVAWGLAAVAVALLGGLLWVGIPADASDAGIHARWIAEFRAAVHGGDPYPRWLPGANEGLGSPVFHFYPPCPFWVAACLPGTVSTPSGVWHLLTATFVAGSVAAGLATFLLAREVGHSVTSALGAAAILVMSPHSLGIVVLTRGALAEHWALAWLLMVITAGLRVEKAAAGNLDPTVERPRRWTAVAGLGGAVGGLLLTHLPTAQLFLPVWWFAAAWHRPRCLPDIGAGCLAGACLAAVHLLPIPGLLGATSGEGSDAFKGAGLERSFVFPELWLGRWEWPMDPLAWRVHGVWAVGMLLAGLGLAGSMGGAAGGGRFPTAGRWFLAGWVCLLMVTPLAQPVYDLLPALRRVQFAHRFLTPAAAFLTVGFLTLTRRIPRPVGSFRDVPGVGAALMLALTVASVPARWRSAGPGAMQGGLEANGEYLPVGGSWADAVEFLRNRGGNDGSWVTALRHGESREQVFRVDGMGSGWRVLPVFWFPTWKAWDGKGRPLPIRMHSGTGLTEVGPVSGGDADVRLRLERGLPERVGVGVSLLTGIGLFAAGWRGLGRRGPRRNGHRPEAGAQPVPGRDGGGRRAGFTLIEVLMVLAVIALVAGLLLPALGGARRRATGARCLGQVRQMAVAMHLYGMDHAEHFPPNRDGRDIPLGETWVRGWLGVPGPDCTNVGHLRSGLLAPYLPGVDVWRCPAGGPVEVGGVRQPRVRHYSINAFLGSPVVSPAAATYRRWHELVRPAPAEALTFIEERIETINDGAFSLQWDFREDRPEAWIVRDQPAVLHGRAGNLAFADGHAETRRWAGFGGAVVDRDDHPAPGHRDLPWLQRRATHREILRTP